MTLLTTMQADAFQEMPQNQLSLQSHAWVQCDNCSKWRRVPKSVADALDDDTPW